MTERPINRRSIILILSIFLFIRVTAFLISNHIDPSRTYKLDPDSYSYYRPAMALADWGCYSCNMDHPEASAYIRPPGYPAFIAVFYRLFGRSLTAVILVQILIGVGTMLLVYLIARRLFDGDTALLAAVFLGLDFASFHLAQLLMSETLFAFLICLAAYLGVRCIQSSEGSDGRNVPPFLFLTGLAITAAVFVREAALYLIYLVAAVFLYVGIRRRFKLRYVAAMLILSIVPYIIAVGIWENRNDRVIGVHALSGMRNLELVGYRVPYLLAMHYGVSLEEMRSRVSNNRDLSAADSRVVAKALSLKNPSREQLWKSMYEMSMGLMINHPLDVAEQELIGAGVVLFFPGESAVLDYFGVAHPQNLPDSERFDHKLNFMYKDNFDVWILSHSLALLILILCCSYLFLLYLGVVCSLPRIFSRKSNSLSHLYLFVFISYLVLVCANVTQGSRYRTPVMPLLSIYAAAGLTALYRSLRSYLSTRGGKSVAETRK